MKVEKLVEIINSDFYTGVPDSQLKALCNYLMNKYGIDKKGGMDKIDSNLSNERLKNCKVSVIDKK